MKQEQRFILALGLILGILTLWSFLSPPSPPPPRQLPPSSQTELIQKPTAPEPTGNFPVGQAVFGLGQEHGGIQFLQLDDVAILEESSPGFFLVEQIEPTLGPLRFENQPEASGLVSRAKTEGGLEIQREIFPDRENRNHLFHLKLSVQNNSPESQKAQLRLVGYRPLHISAPDGASYLAGFASMPDGGMEKLAAQPGRPKQFAQMPAWIASQGKSHALILKPEGPAGMFHVEHNRGETVGWIELPRAVLAPGAQAEWNFQLYAGPLAIGPLQKAGMEGAISFGAFSGVTKMLLKFLSWSHRWLGNYGLAICFLSLAIYLPFSPLTWFGMHVSQKTMARMAELKPQEERIRREHKGNPQKAQQELMQLYRKHGVNPASGCIGCLPFLFTWPIYIGLFQVLNRAPELRGAAFLWIRDLSAPDALVRFPTKIPLIGEGLNILPVLATVAMFFQQKAMQRPQAMTDEQKIQQKMLSFMPVMLLLFFYNLPSGFMLYWVVNSTLMAGQQLLIGRKA